MCIRDRCWVCLVAGVFLINSRSHLVSSTSLSLGSKSHHQSRRTFSRSYGAILPSSFTQVLSSALVFSTRPPVSVWGTVPFDLKLRSFSWKHGIDHFCSVEHRHQFSALWDRICLIPLPTALNRDNHRPAGLAFSVTPSQSKGVQEY